MLTGEGRGISKKKKKKKTMGVGGGWGLKPKKHYCGEGFEYFLEHGHTTSLFIKRKDL